MASAVDFRADSPFRVGTGPNRWNTALLNIDAISGQRLRANLRKEPPQDSPILEEGKKVPPNRIREIVRYE
jgi:hypothetical protein